MRASPTFDVGKKLKSNKTMYSDLSIFQSKFKEMKLIKLMNSSVRVLLIFLVLMYSKEAISQTITYDPAPTGGVISICHGGVLTVTVNGTVSGEEYILNVNPPYGVETLMANGSSLTFTPVSYADLGQFGISVIRTTAPVIFFPNQTINVVADPTAPTLTLSNPEGSVNAGTMISATLATAGSGGVTGSVDDYEYSIDGGMTWLDYTLGNNISTTGYMMPPVKIKAFRAHPDGLGCYAETIYTWTVFSRVHDITGDQGSYYDIQQAIDAPNTVEGDVIKLDAGTIALPSVVNVNKAITLQGNGINNTIVELSSSWFNTAGGYAFTLNAEGITVNDIHFKIVGKGQGNILYISKSNTTIEDNKFSGEYVNGDGEVTRAAVWSASPLTGLAFNNNIIESLRQPGYINNGSGTISNNTITNTRGWVIAGTGTLSMTGNTFNNNTSHITVLEDSNISGLSISNNDLSGMVNDWRIDNRAGVLQATCNWFGSADYTTIDSKNKGKVVFVPYKTSLIGACDGTNAIPANLELVYSASGENVQLKFDVTDNDMQLRIIDIPGYVPTDPGYLPLVAALYATLKAATDPDDIQAAALAVGDDILAEYYYFDNYNNKVYLKTINNNELVKNKYWDKYLVRTTDLVRFPDWANGITLVEPARYSTSTNPSTGAVASGWLNPVLGRDLYVDVTFIHNGTVTTETKTVAIGAGPIKNLDTGLGFATIQEAIDSSSSGDRIGIAAGTYTGDVNGTGKTVTLVPGNSPGCVTINGNLTLVSTNTLEMEVEGTTACTEYDQFIVNGTVSLGGAILDLNLGMSYTPTVGDSYTFIANNDTDAITGQFAQGSTISKSGHVFTIDYDGGDGNDVVLTNCAGGIVNNNTGNGYCSIQDAIDAATAGDVIEITAASITEGQIVIDKSLTIQGLGSSLTKVFSSYVTTGSGHSNPTTAWIRTEPGTNVNIKDLSLDGNSNSTIVALRFQSGGSVDGVAFNDIKSGAYLGTAVQVLNGEVNIENSTFTNIGRIGAHFRNGVIVNADISGSFINNIYTGKGVGDWLDYALDISGGVGPLSVEGNRITNNKGVASTDGSTSAGILVSTYFPLPNNSVPNNVTIQGNSLSNNYAGVAVGYNAGDMSVVSITGNDIFDNDYGVTTTGPEVDATNNYWGAPDGPSGEGSGSGDEIDAGINACPFYDGPVATGTLTNCRVVVYQGTSTTVRSSHMNIQDAIDESTTANGDVITVAAGTYAENVTVNKALDIRGPKYNVAGNGLGRGAGEAIVVPAVSGITWTNDAIFKVTASDVSINGFTIDGDNPLITTGYSSTTTADIDAGLGVSVGGTGINNLKVSNNIIQNLTLFAVYGESTNTTGHLVQNNLIRDLGTYDTTSGVPYWGGGVYIGNKTYANILDNVMENVRIGVQTGQFGAVEPAPQLSHNISGNIIQARKRGIFFNEHYNGTPFVVSNNNISALQNAIETSWNGMLIAGQWNNSSTFTNNIIDGSGKTTGTSKGIEVWRVKEIAQPLISGGTISNVDIGLYLNNFEGDNNNNDAPQGTFATASEMTISPNTGGVGIRILDSNSSTHGPVQITLGTNMIVNGGANGLVLENASAKVISPLGNLALNSQTSKYIKLIGNANDIDATSVLFDAKLGSAMTDTELFATEDKIDHKIDLATLGLVTVKSNSFYVTTNSFVSPNTSPLIQRAIDAASNGDVIAVDAGTYAENVLVNKSLELYGAGEGVTTIIPSFVGAAPPSCLGSDCTGASNVIKIAANNVHLHDFSIDGNNPALTSGIVISGVDIDARNGIISDGSSGRSNLEINKVTVSNIYLRAIYPQFTTNMNVHHNTVSNVRGPSGSIAIMSWASSGTMSNNTVFDVNDAIVANHSLGITFSNNTVTNSDSGIHSDNNGSGGGATADVITGNTISNGSGSNSWGIFVYVPYKNTVVSDNTITNVHVGITTTGALGTTNPTVTISGNTIDGQSLSGSTGAYITTSTFGYADGNNNTIFTNNFITNTDQLMELEAKTGFTNNFVANDNSFTNNNVGIVKSGGGTITENLTCNWWGSTASGDVMAAVGAGTNYAPWLTSGMDDSSDAGFQPEEFACSGNPVVIDNMTSQPQTCATGGTITVDFSGGTAPYDIAWTGGSASGVTSPYDITGLQAGSYNVTITDTYGSTATELVNILYLPVTNMTAATHHVSIQAAINAASQDDEIVVCDGTYAENVVIDKALHISSLNGSGATTIEPVSGYPVAINAHVGGPFEDVSMDGFTINSHGAIALISYSGTNDGYNVDGLILNDLVVDANGQYGLALFDVNNALIDNVTITNANTGMEMIGMANLSIDNSSITGSTGKAINLSKSAGYEKNMNVSITNSSITGGTTNVIAIDMKSVTGTLTLDENEISNNTGFGFRIDNTPTDDALALNITNNNFIANGGVAVYIEDDNSLDQITANINNNIFHGNRKALGVQEILSLNVTANIFRYSTQNAVEIFSNNVKLNNNSFVGNAGTYALLATVPTNAQYNWWGDASGPSGFGPGSGQPVSDNVNYCPWLNGIPAVLGGSGAPVPVEVINTTSGKVFCSIQDAINDIDTHNGDIITASPGIYPENVTVNKEVDIRGPKYNIAGNGSGRGTGEAIVVPADIANNSEIFMVKASNVSINGFTIDGDNTALTSGWEGTNGADIDAFEGVTIYDASPVVNNLVVSNNIIQNLAYFGVTLFGASNYSDANTSKTGHEISNNLIRNMGHYNTGNGYDKWGGGVLLYNSHYAHVANNTMTNVRIGVQTGNFQTAHTGLDPTYRKIENNTIEARAVGIFYNLQNYTPFSIEDNTITGIYDADEEAGATRAWKGISIASLSSNMGPSDIIGNNIDGTGLTYSRGLEGINVWNVNSNSPANISGGTITNVNTGIFVNNFEGYSSNATNGAHATISGVTINASEVGVRVLDSPSSTTHAKVNATVTNTTINAGTDGIKVEQTDNSGAQAGGVFTENTINATTSGINIARSTTSTTNPLTISDNAITLSSQLAGGVPTTGIVLNNVNGTAAATVSDNTITNPFFGYGIYNLNTSPASTITGDTITGILQGVASVNTLDNTNFAPSVFNLSGMTMSGFTGDHPSLSAINFHAGVYAFTGGADGSSSITSTISDMDISGTGKITADCAGLAFADFSTAATTMQNITINASNIHDNLNRGIHARGSNTVVTVNTSTISNNGYDAFGTGGNIGFSIVALKDATVNANNNFITLPANGNKVYGLSTGNGSANQIIAHNNSILRNGNTNPASKLAQATGTNSIDATCNWWGTTVCPADEVSGDVTVYPFITNGTDDNVAPGFQPVAGSCAEPSITATVTGPGGSIIMDSGNDYTMTICSGQEVTTSSPAVINIEAANCASLRVQTVYTTTISTLPPTQTVDLAYAMASIAPPTTISPENHDGVAKDIVFVSTPYYDVNGNGSFDAGDVAGGTITFTLTVEPLPIVSNTVTSGAYSQVMTSGGSYTHSICHDTDITTSIPSLVSGSVSSCGVLRMNTQYISTLPNIPSATLDETYDNVRLAGPQTISPNNTTGSPQTITFITTAYYDLDGSGSLTAGDIVGDVTNFVLTIHPIPTAAISGTATVEQFDPITPVITFTGAGGTQPYTFTYNINGGANQTVTTPTGLNSTTVAHDNSVLGVFTYNLVSAVDGNGCSATILTDPPLAVIQVVLPGEFVELAPFIARPDNVIFGLGESKDGYVQFKNGGEANSAGPVTFRVYKPANFTLTLSNTISQITPSGESTPVAVSNSSPDWTITWKSGSGGYYEIYSNVTGVIGGLSNVKFGFTLVASSSAAAGEMKVDIIDASGGDKNKYNNVTNKGFNIN